MDLLVLTKNAFQFLQEEHGFDSPSLKYESRDKYNYVLFKKDNLDVAVIFWPPQLPSVMFTQYPSEMSAPVGLPYSKSLVVGPDDLARDLDRYPLHQATKRPLTGWWFRWQARRRKQTELEREVARCVFDLGRYASARYEALLEALARQEV